MPLLQALIRCSLIVLFLELCLQLVTGQDDIDRKPLIVTLSSITPAKANETTEVKCSVSTELREYVAVNISLVTLRDTKCYPKPFDVQACISPEDPPRNFYFNLCSQISTPVACVVTIIEDKYICDSYISVVPSMRKTNYDIKTFLVNK
ncbi:prolactin-inducible protein homolog [Macrotis lagotis]|uniref:prolactin-inducible protein homolog n=1 Tax=Macrotis lagotis TaxID=92651 RepID=UPI003D6878DA